MEPSRFTIHARRAAAALLLLGALAPRASSAEASYNIRSIFQQGDTVAGVKMAEPFGTLALNDQGDLVVTGTTAGGGRALFLYADGKFTPIVVPGQDAPGGKWPRNNDFRPPAMNKRGNIVFAAQVTTGSVTGWSVFRWDRQTRQVTPAASLGMPAVNGLTFVAGGRPELPAINNRDEIAFSLSVPDAAGKAQGAAFFLGGDGKLLPIALPDQALPGGATMLRFAGDLSLNDAGVVAFRAAVRRGDGSTTYNAYMWEKGTLTPVVTAGEAAPGGGTIDHVGGVYANNKDRSLLVAASRSDQPTQAGLYRFAEGRLTPLSEPGQELPGGGKLRSIPEATWSYISRASEGGQHAFIAALEGGGYAVCQLEPGTRETGGGKLSLILPIPTTTELGEIKAIPTNSGLCLNSQGQVAMFVTIAGRAGTIVLLTPAAVAPGG